MPARFVPRGHLGAEVSALVDGQLDPVAEERAWAHVHACPACRHAVEQEGWTKRRLQAAADGEPSAQLLGSLYSLAPLAPLSALPPPTHPDSSADYGVFHGGGSQTNRGTPEAVRDSWAAVAHLEAQGRGRRRAGLAVAGAGSVSAAVIGLSALGGATLGIGGAGGSGGTTPSVTSPASPTATPTGSPGPVAPGRSTRPAPLVFGTSGTAGLAPSWQLTEPTGGTLSVSVDPRR